MKYDLKVRKNRITWNYGKGLLPEMKKKFLAYINNAILDI